MPYQGTCLQTYIPIRKEASSDSEMVSSLIFGESFTVHENRNSFLKIINDFDNYEGWISANSYSEFTEYDSINEHIFIEAVGDHQIMFIPCGAQIPESGNIIKDNQIFKIERKLKTYHHLPISLRLQKLALQFQNMPYLWGGRTFMGVDCSGFVQIVYKANGFNLFRDTNQQMNQGKPIESNQYKPCDLVFFTKPGIEIVSHVGMVIDNNKIIHASSVVRIDKLNKDGIIIDGQLEYTLHSVRRML